MNIKEANKDAKIYFGRSTTVHNLFLFSPSYILHEFLTKTFLLVSSAAVVNNHCGLCTVKAKKENKNIQRDLGFYYSYALFTKIITSNSITEITSIKRKRKYNNT